MEQQNNLQFINFTPLIHIGFWTLLGKKKVEEWKLDATTKTIITKFKNGKFKDKKSQLVIDAYSFDEEIDTKRAGPLEFKIKSQLLNFNTTEEFKNIQDNEYIQKEMQRLIENIDGYLSGKNDSLELYNTLLLTFADLKKYIYTFKLLNQTLIVDNFKIVENTNFSQKVGEEFTKIFDQSLRKFVDNEALKLEPVFGYDSKSGEINTLVNTLKNYNQQTSHIVVFDPFNQNTGVNAHLYNVLAALLRYKKLNDGFDLSQVKIILMKDVILHKSPQKIDFKCSQLMTVNLLDAKISMIDQNNYDYTGKEGLKQARQINLKDQMDELSLAKDAIDLNVKLMKWRMLPDLDFQQLKDTKILLIGAGTLGCQLSRNLIGWGIQNITFVDNGKISYSNPVRQSLYEFEDSTNGGQSKALTAAKKLKKIFPEINAEGVEMSIPMPGHFLVNDEQQEQALKNVDLLEKLVESHDAMFLMTDNRESRWLPTVLANKFNKICITIGLGFDSYVIVRHGSNSEQYLAKPQDTRGDRLSCYFCNDVSVPGNSMKDRTLDQQCTVTRPGLSFVSAAYASELLISLLSHPLKNECPAHEDKAKLQETDLGIIPQHIRGNMSEFETQIFYGKAFTNCIACSDMILQEYNKNRDEFLLTTINDNDFLHKVAQIEIKELEEGDIIEIDDDF